MSAGLNSPTISERLADHVGSTRFDELPPHVVEKAKELLVYQLYVAFRGRSAETAQPALDLAVELSGEDAQCSIIGDARRARLLEAVLANSYLISLAGQGDYVLPPGVNPGCVVQPAAWAIGELSHTTGRELLTAVVVGYDVMTKLCSPVWAWEIDAPRPLKYVMEPFGVAATASRLLGLSHAQTVYALGHAGQFGSGTFEGSGYPWLHAHAARNGVFAALLARAGMPAPETIIEGRHGVYRSLGLHAVPETLDSALATLGGEFEVCNAQTKRYVGSALNVVPIDLAEQLVAEHALRPDRVASLVVTLPAERAAREQAYDHLPGSGIRYLMATIVTGGSVDVVGDARPPDGPLLEMREKVQLRFESGRPLQYARIEVTTTDRRLCAVEGDSQLAPGVDWRARLVDVGQTCVPRSRLDILVELIGHLEELPDVGAVTSAMRA